MALLRSSRLQSVGPLRWMGWGQDGRLCRQSNTPDLSAVCIQAKQAPAVLGLRLHWLFENSPERLVDHYRARGATISCNAPL